MEHNYGKGTMLNWRRLAFKCIVAEETEFLKGHAASLP